MGFAEDDNPIQTLLLNQPHEALRIRMAVGRLERRLHDANTGGGQGPSECGTPLGVAVTDEDAAPAEYAIIGTSQHTSDLAHESVIRIGRRSHEVHASRLEINHEGRVVRNQPAHGPHFCGEEVRRDDRTPDDESARRWVARFVSWYNDEHHHRAIRYVTPNDRHLGADIDILARRHALYEQARSRKPERWPRNTRNWTPLGAVVLNPEPINRDRETA